YLTRSSETSSLVPRIASGEPRRASLSPEPPHVPPLGGRLHRPAAARRDAARRPGGRAKGRGPATEAHAADQPPAGAARALLLPGEAREGLRTHAVSEAAARASWRLHGVLGPVASGLPGRPSHRGRPADGRGTRRGPLRRHPQHDLARPGGRRAARRRDPVP